MSNAAVPLVRRLERSPSEIVRDGRRTRASSLYAAALGTAAALHRDGLRPGDRVLVLVPPGPDFVVTLLGLVWLGAVPVLAEPTQAPGAWAARIAAAAPKAAVIDPRLRWAWRIPLLQRFLPALPPRPEGVRIVPLPSPLRAELPPADRSDEDEALVLFTSGTTASPRVVVHTHGTLAAFLAHVEQAVSGLHVSSYLAETPQQLFYALLLDATCHVVSGVGEARLGRTLQLLGSGQIEAWFGSPWTWVRWLQSLEAGGGRAVPDTLRTVLLGSSPVTRPFLQRLLPILPAQTRVRCVYGLTEAGPVCTADGREKAELAVDGDWVGAPVPGVALRLQDREVQVRSDSVAPALRQEGWLPTGDLGVLAHGGLALQGRRKDMIVRRGVNLYPGVLEPLLDQTEVALVGVYDPSLADERVVLVCAQAPSADQLARLGQEAAPDHVLVVGELPRGGRQHKVDKEALRSLARLRLGIALP
jgi:acyl-CoA synthetase (AMP-forming)/AMP-acid ligase II